MCGANPHAPAVSLTASGSSPRVRGKRPRREDRYRHQRIIPACAGQTFPSSAPRREATDHPRVCGANRADNARRRIFGGSSPRVRGKLLYGFDRLGQNRIIPACAGQTWRPALPTSCVTDHPRVCGANNAEAERQARAYGSSPRVRGKHAGGFFVVRPIRIIPACAGQTFPKSPKAVT